MNSFIHKLAVGTIAAVAALASTQSSALAQVTIVCVDGGGTAPATVAGGGNLADIFNAAARWWEDSFVTTPYTLTLTFSWGPQSGSTLAAHNLTAQGGTPNRETAGTIVFDNDGSSSFFLDPTPCANNEFTTGPTYTSSDLGGGLINVGRTYGGATGSASGRTDLFAVALHEIGHALGMSSANSSFVAENTDGDIDVVSPLPFAGSALPTVSGAHLNIATSLLFPSISTGIRRWPTAADVLANAQISQMTDVLRGYEPTGPRGASIGTGAIAATLTTAPNFVSNNNGLVGGAVYFTLRVNTLLNLTGIDVNATLTAGTAMEAEFYVNTASNDLANLATVLPANNWQLRGRLTGTAAGPDVASQLTFLDAPSLAPGTYLVALTGCYGNRYTNGTGTNEVASSAALTFTGGAATNELFRGSPFTPRVFNGTFRYVQGCGDAMLTTPPEFVSNNSGSTGGAVYFQLDNSVSFGRVLCGIDVHAGAVAGTPLTADLYVNAVETNVGLLTTGAPSLAASNWVLVSSMSGVSNGLGMPSPMALATPLALPIGSFVMALVGNFDHRYTNGTATNTTATAEGLTFTAGGASNVPFTGTVFTPRVLNATFQFDVPTSPITNFPFQALANNVGQGCGGSPSQIYETFATGTFDLATRDILYSMGAGAVTTSVTGGTAIVAPVAPDLGLGDDQNTAPIPLGFTIDGICASAISVSSNGFIWLGGTGSADFTPSESELVSQGARVAPYWTDLNPPAGGSIHVDIGVNVARVTYLNVFSFGGASAEVTTQVELRPNSIRIRYSPAGGAYTRGPITGLTNGVAPAAAPGSLNLSAGGIATQPWNSNLRMTALARPKIGSSTQFLTVGIPSGALGASLLALGPAVPGIPLAPLTPAGCNQYHPPGASTLSIFFGSCSGTSTLNIPANQSLVGILFTVQSASLGTSILTSNGVNCRVGAF